MITQNFAIITLSGGGSYTFPVGFVSIDRLVYTSDDGEVFDSDFKTNGAYTLVGNTITYDAQYTGTVDQYYNYNGYIDPTGDGVQIALDDMYLKFVTDCGLDTDEALAKDGNGNYVDTILFNQFRNEVNRAIRKITRERFKPTLAETVILNEDLIFDITTLSQRLKTIELLADSNGREFSFERVSTSQYKVPCASEGDSLQLTYAYVPVDMVNLTDPFPLPEGDVDPDIIGYWANYMYFKVDGNAKKANTWLELWNDSFESEINSNRGETHRIKNVYEEIW